MNTRICSEADLEAGTMTRVEIGGIPIALIKDESGCCHAIGDTCSHADISLSEGFVENGTVECWAHGAIFDVATGAALTLPATEAVPVYRVHVIDGEVYIDTTTEGAA